MITTFGFLLPMLLFAFPVFRDRSGNLYCVVFSVDFSLSFMLFFSGFAGDFSMQVEPITVALQSLGLHILDLRTVSYPTLLSHICLLKILKISNTSTQKWSFVSLHQGCCSVSTMYRMPQQQGLIIPHCPEC